jgi:hypothetical protein
MTYDETIPNNVGLRKTNDCRERLKSGSLISSGGWKWVPAIFSGIPFTCARQSREPADGLLRLRRMPEGGAFSVSGSRIKRSGSRFGR